MAEGVDWKGTLKFAEAHWPYVLVGLVVIVGIFYTMGGSSGTTAAPADNTAANDAAAVQSQANQIAGQVGVDQAQASLEAAQIAGQVQTTIAQIQANAGVAQSNASAASAAYIATTQAEANTAQYATAAASGQNIQALNSLTQGFSSYTGALAQSIASDATAAAGVVASNDQAGTSTVNATIAGASIIGNALNSGGLFGSLSTNTRNGYLLLPGTSGGNVTNLLSSGVGAGSAGYLDNGTFDLAA